MRLTPTEIRENRQNTRKSMKAILSEDRKLFAKDLSSFTPVPGQFAGNDLEEEQTVIRMRRKTSLDIRKSNRDFDMFECSEIYISNAFESLYELVRKIDEGTQSVVHLCKEKATGNLFAVKVLRNKDPDLMRNLKEQFRILKNLSHDNIIKAHNLFVNEKIGVCHLVTDYCEYENLRVFLNKQRTCSEVEAAHILSSILSTLAYLHSVGVCHRDIKPENIMYDPSTGQLKLIDFEICRMIKYGHEKLAMCSITGTPHYQAPEMLKGFYTHMIDIWAVGVVAYELLAGQLPFYNPFAQEISRQILNDEPMLDFSHLTESSINFMRNCLQKDPLKRFTAEQALQSPFMLRYSSISGGQSPKHKKNGSEGTRKGSYEFEISRCFDQDSQLLNTESLILDSGIRLIADFCLEANQKS